MPDDRDIPQVTMANTKKEMMEAYQSIKRQLQAKEKERLDADKARKEMEKKAATATAQTQASQDPLKRLSDLRSHISRELTGLAERFEQELGIYQQIQTAVKAKKEELDTIYGVETAAADLAALIESQQAKKEEFEQEMKAQRMAFEEEMHEVRNRWDKEKAEQEQGAKEQAGAFKKQQQREKEESEYAFAREKAQRKNALDDELHELENEIAQKRKDFEQELNVRKAEIEAREEALSKRETDMAALQKEVDTFPQRLQENVQAAVQETTDRLTNDFDKSKALLEAKFQGERDVLASKIESLQNLVKSQESQISELSRRNEQAYEKVQDIANRAVAAAKREYISIPTSSQAAPNQPDKETN